jgi:protoporphyrinogen oxidase
MRVMADKTKSWGIIGGGIMGMTLAMRLSQKGYNVTIIENCDKLGGLTSGVEMDGVVWDRFYHVILMSDLNTRRILREIGLEDKLKWVETKTGFYSGGKLYSMSNIFEFLKFPGLTLIDKFRLGITIIAASMIKDWKKMEKIPVEKWLCRWSGKRVFNKIWLPLLKSKLGNNYKETSASFIWTTIQRMYAARRTGLKKEMFGYVSGGYSVINNAFEEKLRSLGVKIQVNTSVEKVSRNKDGYIMLDTKSSGNYRFDAVISTVSSEISVRIAPSMAISEIKKHTDIKYLGVICPSILLKNPISKYYVTNITDTWPPFTGIIEMTALVDRAEMSNKSLVYLPKYIESDHELFKKSDAELIAYFLDPLFRMYPDLSDDDILHFNVNSARAVFSLPTLLYSEKLPAVTTTLQGYHILNTAQIINGTNNVNETIEIAEVKLAEILDTFQENCNEKS